MIAAASIIQGIGPQKNLPNIFQALTFFSSSALVPYLSSRAFASVSERPTCELTPSRLNASGIAMCS